MSGRWQTCATGDLSWNTGEYCWTSARWKRPWAGTKKCWGLRDEKGQRMIQTLLAITKADEFNFISPKGLGDTATYCGLMQFLEAGYGSKIHFIIKPSHVVVMKMYAIDDYSIYTFSESELRGIARHNNVPQIGQLYIAHPIYSDITGLMWQWQEGKFTQKQLFCRFFNLDDRIPENSPVWYPELNDEIKRTVGFPLVSERTVLLLPEAHSVSALKQKFWLKLAKQLVREGYDVIQSCQDKYFALPDIPDLTGDLETLVAAALSCIRVYSLRSGICDLIKEKSRDLTVFYPTKMTYETYFMEYPNVKNILVKNKTNKTNAKILKKIPVKIKKALKTILKKLPLLKQISIRFNTVNNRLDQLQDTIQQNDSLGFIYNDLLKLGRML
jgi:hypothetical protein